MENTTFQPPRHWVGPEELSPSYWANPATRERRGQEFHDKPVETIDAIDRLDQKGIARRDFLTLMGASMAMASLSCSRRPVHKIIPYVVQPEEVTPGVANWYATSCPETGMGLLAKTREGRPIKLEGNPDHPMSQGRLSAMYQAQVLGLYDPDRLQSPVARERGGASHAVSWDEADSAIRGKLSRVRVLTGRVLSDSTRALINDFVSAHGGSHVEYEPLMADDLSQAQAECYGAAVVPQYRFDRAEKIVSISADFLGTYLSPVAYAADFAKTRKPEAKNFSELVVFEPMMSVTGANADTRVPIRPGDEYKVAMAILHEVAAKTGQSGIAHLDGFKPQTVAEEIGCDHEIFKRVAASLLEARGKSIVIAGGKGPDAMALQVAVAYLNQILGNEGQTIDGNADVHPAPSFAAMEKLIADMNAGAVGALIIHRANPVYNLPNAGAFADALKKVPLVVTVTDRDDETALWSDFVLPDHHFLENWGDSQARRGVHALQQPTIAPLFSTRAFQDSLLKWNGKAGTWHDYLRARWQATVYHDAHASGSFEHFWENTLRDGVFVTAEAKSGSARARGFRPGALSKLTPYKAASGETMLQLFTSVAMGDGRHANNAWLQELPDPITSVTWDNYVAISPALSEKLGLSENEVLEIKTDSGATVELPAKVQPGMHPGAIAAAVGYGRTRAGKVGNLNDQPVGANLYPLAQVKGGMTVMTGLNATVRRTGKFYQLAQTQWHFVTENRPVINDITLAEFRKNPGASNETNPELRLEAVPTLWPTHEFNGNPYEKKAGLRGYRWGMAIDLSSCIGCGACTIACQAENNIPVVGRENVRVSRQMHWIRIDRYYTGNLNNPSTVFSPMLCQHCENAPCETVCPVLATVHDNEGTSNQVYNRCVGTRYCQNNCPYKVRRFNFFDHWKKVEGTANLAWNPDVTVRTRGIMEKCSFCIQRIQVARDKAKDQGKRIQDGDIQTACQQTCPTQAIVFGDINDPESRVSKLRENPRAYRVLETLNTKPSISYLSKVRNAKGGEEHHG